MKGAVPVFMFTGLVCATIAGLLLLGFTAAIAVIVFRWLT